MLRVMVPSVTALFLFAGCSKGPDIKEQIIGKWQQEKASQTTLIQRTGDVVISEKSGNSLPLNGKIIWVATDTIDITIERGPGKPGDDGTKYLMPNWMTIEQVKTMLDSGKITVRSRVEIKGTEMVLTFADDPCKFIRID